MDVSKIAVCEWMFQLNFSRPLVTCHIINLIVNHLKVILYLIVRIYLNKPVKYRRHIK